jgi:hypothetical protein
VKIGFVSCGDNIDSFVIPFVLSCKIGILSTAVVNKVICLVIDAKLFQK